MKINEHLDEKNFAGKKLDNFIIECKCVTACDFTNTVITNADIYATVLCSSDFSGAKISNSKFAKCNCDYTVFNNSEISDTEFIRNDFMESTICGTVFSNVKFISEAYNKKTDFSGCVFKNVLFDYHIFSGNFRGAVFSDIHFGKIFWEHCKINIGTDNDPKYLCNEEVHQWILKGGAK